MNCHQCGAPMVLVRERDYYFCEYCGVYHFPSSSEDGIRDLGKAPERITCPLCKVPLNMVVLDDHYRGHQCSNCQGILFNRSTFRVTLDGRRARAKTPPEPPVRPQDEELERKVHCPKCAQLMSTHRYLGPGNIIIDTCGTCNLIWLDYGELNKAVNAPGKDRGAGTPDHSDYIWEEIKKDEYKKKKKKQEKFEKDLVHFLDKFLD